MRLLRLRREHYIERVHTPLIRPTGHVNDHALQVGASIQQAHNFVRLSSSESLQPVVVDR
jgi:hypothetical protein